MCLLPSSWLSTYMSLWLPLDGFPWNLIFGTSTKICQELQIWLKLDKNIGHFTWGPKYVYLSQGTKIWHKSISVQQPLLILLTVMCSSATHRLHCCISTATLVKWKCHNVMLYIICLSCLRDDGSIATFCHVVFMTYLHHKLGDFKSKEMYHIHFYITYHITNA
jgi:hypothetical protein